MSAFVLIVIFTIGFIYTSRELEARFRQKRSTNWESYFHIARWGFLFWLVGIVVIILLWAILWGVSFMYNIPSDFGLFNYERIYWHSDFYNLKVYDFSLPIVMSLVIGALISFAVSEAKVKEQSSQSSRLDVLSRVAASDGLQSLLIQAVKTQMLVMLTLKSRKVYIGNIKDLDHEQVLHCDYVVIIPMISGFRDKDSLVFSQSHSYVSFYRKNNIGPDTSPLSINDFRVALPRTEIESVSLFEPLTFLGFQDLDGDGASELVNRKK
ncbi:hypothetical protein [Aeromonas dhakensis]|uniref:hypothetical protein n=1 Tax=Aeromonas dhakensis TaxID=196024 RepID=UPI003BA32F5E